MSDSRARFELDFLKAYSDDSLLAEVRRVASKHTSETLTCREFERLSGRVSASTIRRHFGGWQNALNMAGLGEFYGGPHITEKMRVKHGRGMSNNQLVAEMRRIHALANGQFLTKSAFDLHSGLNSETISRRIGSWRNAVRHAGLPESPIGVKGWTREECFENIANVWEHLGKRPHYDDMNRPPSKINARAYETRWGAWRRALTDFVDWANADEGERSPDRTSPRPNPAGSGKTADVPITVETSSPRRVSLKVRFKVMRRDNFRCLACGRSPATHTNLSLHIDHIIPVVSGGTSEEDNLQTLCEACNLGKGVSAFR